MMVATLQGTAARTAKKRPIRHRSANRSVKANAAARPLLSRQSKAGKETLKLPKLRGTLSVIISARNEEQTLSRLLHQVARLEPAEIIVVLNGRSDNSFLFLDNIVKPL